MAARVWAVPREAPLRIAAVGLLALVFAAPVSALAVGLHVVNDEDHGAGLMATLAQIATHGHDHDVSTSEHEHPTLRSAGPQVPPPLIVSALDLPAEPSSAIATVAAGFAEAPPPTGSPPLFRKHCALLL